jgi:hypothetical protein
LLFANKANARRAAFVAMATCALLGSETFNASPAAPPLYDGLGLGNEPYRYLTPPAGYGNTPRPSSVHTMTAGSAPVNLSTSEMYPQASLTTSSNAFATARPSTQVTLTITAVPPPTGPPPGYRFDGNIYRFTATAAGAVVGLSRGADVRIALRGTGARGTPLVALFAAGRWRVLPSPPTGIPDQYSAATSALGDAALVIRVSTGASKVAGIGPPATSTPLVVIATALTLMLVSFLLIRITRQDRRSGTEESR